MVSSSPGVFSRVGWCSWPGVAAAAATACSVMHLEGRRQSDGPLRGVAMGGTALPWGGGQKGHQKQLLEAHAATCASVAAAQTHVARRQVTAIAAAAQIKRPPAGNIPLFPFQAQFLPPVFPASLPPPLHLRH